MTTHAMLGTPELRVLPGSEATCDLTVRNTGDLVEAYEFDVVGDAAAWATVEPPSANLYPGDETTARVVFQPLRSPPPPAGEIPFAVRVRPSLHADDAVAPEGTIWVEPLLNVGAEVLPRTSRAWYQARHEVAVDNRGNVPVTVTVAGDDPDRLLTFRAQPPTLTVGPGQAAFVRLTARNRRVLWRGQPVTHPFQVLVTPDGETPVVLDAALLQTAAVPRAAGRLAAGLLALAVLLLAGWFFLVKPAAESAAKEAVQEPLAEVSAQAETADQKAEAADQKAQTADEKAEDASGGGTRPKTTKSPGSAAAKTKTTPARLRMRTEGAPGTTVVDPHVVPERNTLVITDLVLQNPQGDTGRVEVLVGDDAILTMALANFRDIDYHFVSPIEVPAGRRLSLRTTCRTAGADLTATPADRCQTLLLVSGSNRVVPAPAA
ncbi:COG1470 family protein [Couchioplanes azureus]|uniref:COG1470 family protein n=1 Tax=Couchioplanes caeruleus TaxID=56438 RepID=UPI001671644B|nr:hypothetical protein [Couchioplanes caeruleus]GGQ82585.1 hypothetical protein GCM10010166_60950 [Couchioplanes caeruleus subsp. azureus]